MQVCKHCDSTKRHISRIIIIIISLRSKLKIPTQDGGILQRLSRVHVSHEKRKTLGNR